MNIHKVQLATLGAGVLLLGGIIYQGYKETQRRHEYNRAYRYAVSVFGDGRAPMNNEEFDRWYSAMGISRDEKPSKKQLENFIEWVQDRAIIDGKMPKAP